MGLLENKVVIVTGGASGIGRAAALMMAREGASVVVSDVNVPLGEDTVTQIHNQGGGAIFVRADVSKAADVRALVDETQRAYGRLDGAFNNAGIGGSFARLADKDEADFDATIGVNLKGVWLCMKYQIPLMLEGGGGAIVNMASVAGLIGAPNLSIYSASKHGVVGLTKSAALEYARRNLRINAVCPGYTATPMVGAMVEAVPQMAEATVASIPMRRLGTPDEIAEAVVWLCSDKAAFITGHALALDGGLSAG